ncbi:MAG: hypothetical protein H7A25_15730 [Leptospiraceae bacterium]|nr:hypothetical protein [Leptospiraceae bacterium]
MPKRDIKIFDKSEIEKKLIKLALAEVPKLNTIGAMCYSMVPPPDLANYICPICSEKTVYKSNYAEYITYDLGACRNKVKHLKALGAVLDESQFCKNCSPNIEKPKLCLKIKIQGEKEHKTCNVTTEDLDVLREFIKNNVIHVGYYDEEYPLKKYINRIIELLGISIDKETKKIIKI